MDAPAVDSARIAQAVEVLKRGGLVAVPTETVYGLAADATQRSRGARDLRREGPPGGPSGDRARRRRERDRRLGARSPRLGTRARRRLLARPADAGPEAQPAGARRRHRRAGHRRPALPGASVGARVAAGLRRRAGGAEREPLRAPEPDHGGARARGPRREAGGRAGPDPRRRRLPGRHRVHHRRPVRRRSPRCCGRARSRASPSNRCWARPWPSRAATRRAHRAGSNGTTRRARRSRSCRSIGSAAGWRRCSTCASRCSRRPTCWRRCARQPAVQIAAPDDAEAYARELYANLHELDQAAADRIVVSAPPDGPEWTAIHDRLRRAQAGSRPR